jgi:tetratricopeptide (TPR) repeat protein
MPEGLWRALTTGTPNRPEIKLAVSCHSAYAQARFAARFFSGSPTRGSRSSAGAVNFFYTVSLKAYVLILLAVIPTATAQDPPGNQPTAELKQLQALFAAGATSLQAKKFADAEVTFGKLRTLDSMMGSFGLAQAYMAQGKEADARRILGEEAAKNPARPEFPIAIGDIAVRTGRYDMALEEFQKALSLLGFSSASGFYLHRGAYGADPLTDSLAAIGGPDKTPKGAAGIYLRISEVYGLKKDTDGAITALRKARELQPHDAAVLANLGIALEASGKKEEAIGVYREALKANANDPVVLNNLAFLMADNGGDLFIALRYARRAQFLQPETLEITDTVGWVSLKQGWIDDAILTFSDLVRKQPGNRTFRAHLLAALDKKPEPSATEQELKAALKGEPADDNNEKILTLLKPPEKQEPF